MFESVQRILWTTVFEPMRVTLQGWLCRYCYDNLALLNQRLEICFFYWFKYLLLTVQMRSFAQGSRVTCVCVCVCECQREREREREKERVTVQHFVCKHIRGPSLSVTWLCSPLWLELMVKLRTLLTVLHLFWKLKLAIMERGIIFPTLACGVRPITMHWVSWPIRADWACRKEGLCRKRHVWERRGIEELQ